MPRLGTFYLSRLIKIQITSDEIVESIRNPETVKIGDYNWTFTDYQEFEHDNTKYYFAKMTKYIAEGEVPQIDHKTNTTSYSITPDMIEASSPFIYIPQYSGIGYLHIWNKIEERTFRLRFENLVEEKHHGFFVNCKLEPISDIKTFLEKVIAFDNIDHLYAKVNPPNPAFGHLWRDLDTYMRQRKVDEVIIDEKSSSQINNSIKRYVEMIANSEDLSKITESPAIGDAAILMAADGYGTGKIEGFCNGFKTVVNTQDNAVVVKLVPDIEPEQLYIEMVRKLREISQQRYMGH